VSAANPPQGGYYVLANPPKGGRHVAAGVWLGVGIAIKLMPALLLAHFLVRRQFRAILVAIVSALVLIFGPALLASGVESGTGAAFVESGFSRISGLYTQYARELLVPMMTTPEGNTVLAYSVASVVQRALGANPALWIDVLCASVVLGTIAVLDVRLWRPRGHDLAAAAAYLVSVVLISPKSETHHLAFAMPAVALCFGWLFAARSGGPPEARSPGPPKGGHYVLLSSVALVAAPFCGAAEGPMITAAMVLLIAAVAHISTRSTPR
jgi:hypothetical protein